MEVNECTYEYLECQRFVFAVRNQISAQVCSLPPPFHCSCASQTQNEASRLSSSRCLGKAELKFKLILGKVSVFCIKIPLCEEG